MSRNKPMVHEQFCICFELDLRAWEEERQFILSRQGDVKNEPNGTVQRAWTRDDLYDF